jgi:hypothetical protein
MGSPTLRGRRTSRLLPWAGDDAASGIYFRCYEPAVRAKRGTGPASAGPVPIGLGVVCGLVGVSRNSLRRRSSGDTRPLPRPTPRDYGVRAAEMSPPAVSPPP